MSTPIPSAAPVASRRGVVLSARLLGSMAAVLAVLGTYGALFHAYAIDFPKADDYSQLLAVPQYFAAQPHWTGKLAYLSELSVEHRILTLRLAALIQAHWLGGISFTGLMLFGAALLLGTVALLVHAAPRTTRAPVAVIAAALLFSPANHEAHFWANGALQHFGVIAYAFAGIASLARRGRGWSIAALVLMLAAAFTSANGLMALAVSGPMLLIAGRRREAVAWAIIAIAAFGLYFIGADPQQATASPLDAIRHPDAIVRFALLALGSVVVHPLAAALLGLALVGAWSMLLATRARAVPLQVTGWAAFIFASTLAMAVGRAQFGDEGALLSRYRAYSAVLVVTTLIALTDALPARWRARTMHAVAALVLIGFAAAFMVFAPSIAYESVVLQASRNHYAVTGHAIYGAWPPQRYGDFQLERARVRSYFVASGGEVTPLEVASGPLTSIDDPPIHVIESIVTPHAVTLRGIAPSAASAAFLWLDDGARRYRARLQTTSSLQWPRRTALVWGTAPITSAWGTYRIGYGVRDAQRGDVVYWTNEWVDEPGDH